MKVTDLKPLPQPYLDASGQLFQLALGGILIGGVLGIIFLLCKKKLGDWIDAKVRLKKARENLKSKNLKKKI